MRASVSRRSLVSSGLSKISESDPLSHFVNIENSQNNHVRERIRCFSTPLSAACNREATRQRMQQPSRHARFMARYASSTNALVAWDFDAREPDELSLRRGASLDT